MATGLLLLGGIYSLPVQAQSITSLQPESGASGTAVRIYGSGFSTTASDNTVEFGATEATVDSAKSTVLYVQVPSNLSGPKDVTVTTSSGSVTSASPFVALSGGEASFPGADKSLEDLRNGDTAWGDLDGDGDLDVVVGGETDADSKQTKVYLNDGNGTFTTASAGLPAVDRSAIALGDVDGDGDLDIVVAGRTGTNDPLTKIFLNDGSANFSEANAGLTNVDFPAADVGDVNGDGALDLVVSGNDADDSTSTTLYLNDGTGSFSAANAGLTDLVSGSAHFADVDGDGDLDLLLTGDDINNSPSTTLFLNDGTGSFSAANAGLNDVSNGGADVGDVNGDGAVDLVVTGENFDDLPTTTLYLNDGSGGFTAASAGLRGLSLSSATLGDVNGDGSPDLLVTGTDANLARQSDLYTNDGTGSFTEARSGLLGVTRGAASMGDADADGDLELALTGSTKNGPRTFIYQNTPVAAATTLNVTALRPRSGDPGTTVRIEGAGFSSTASDNTVEFGGNTATVDSASTTTLFAQVPSGVSGSVPVTVTTPDSSVTAASRFDAVGAGSETFAFDGSLSGVNARTASWGDFDGDGNLDVFVSGSDEFGSQLTRLYLGDGTGGFTQAGAGLTDISGDASDVGDVNGDGNLDVVLGGSESGVGATTTIYLGDGAGGFTETSATVKGIFDGSADFADFNNDGNLDLLITGDNTARVYLGDGQGGFVKANAGLAKVERSSSAVGDVDGDGTLDLAITGRNPNVDESAKVYLGDGSGGFSEVASLTGVDGGSSNFGDVNGDGNLDLLVTGEDNSFNATATMYLGDGTGSFTAAGAGLDGVQTGSSDIGDLNDDGNLDLVVTGEDGNGDGTTTVYFGDGNGGFRAKSAGFPQLRTGASTFTDVDSDGDLDLFLSGTSASGLVANVYKNEPVTAATSLSVTTLRPRTGTVGSAVRVEGSGFSTTASDNTVEFGGTAVTPDSATTTTLYVQVPSGVVGTVPVTVTSSNTTVTAADRFSVVTGGDTTLTDVGAGLTGVSSSSSSWGDFDKDGNLDVVVTGEDDIGVPTTTLYLGDGSGGFSAAAAGLTGVRRSSSAVGDVNGDGNLDLVISGRDNNAAQRTIVYLGDGTGGFTEVKAGIQGVSEGSTTLLDVNDDGNLDLVVTGRSDSGPSTTVYLGYGDGRFAGTSAGLPDLQAGGATAGDLDNDGVVDLVLTGEDVNNNKWAAAYLGDGSGRFTVADSSLTAVTSGSVDAGDLDGDGNLDLVLAGSDSSFNRTTTAFLGQGDGTFSFSDSSMTDVRDADTELGDIDGDGVLDLVVTGEDSSFASSSTLYLGDGSGGFTAFDAGLVGVTSGSVDASDFDADGALDLVVTGSDTSGSPSARVYENGGGITFSDPEAEITPTSLSETLALGDSSRQSLAIANVGTGDNVDDLSYEVQIASRITSQITSKTDVPGPDEPVEYDGPLGPAEPVTERIGWSSPDDGYDWYCAVGTAGQDVTLEVERTSGDIIPNLGVARGVVADGAPFSEFSDGLVAEVTNTDSSASTLTYTPSENGKFTVVVSTYTSENGGDYRLSGSGLDRPSFCGGASWVNVGTPSGSVASGSEDSVAVNFSGTGTPPGEYEALLRVVTNDPEQDTTDVPVSLTIEQPGITLNNPSDLPTAGQAASVTVDFPSDFAPAGARFFYRPAGARTFRDTTRTLSDVGAGGSASFAIPAEAVTKAGVQYYVQVEGSASGVQDSVQFSVPVAAPAKTGFLPVRTNEVAAEGPFETETYRMLTVPLDLGDRSVFDVLTEQYGAYDESQWKLARWDPGASTYRFGSAIDSLRPGEAAWLTTAGGNTVTIQDARSADASRPRPIRLGPGWNQIGSPFSFPVAWANVVRPEPVRRPFAYDTTGYFEAEQLRPWDGVFVFNQADSSVTIEVPPTQAVEEQTTRRRLANAASTTDGYGLKVVASAHRNGQTLQDRPTWLGFSEGADAGFGPKDRAKPPAIQPGVRLGVMPNEGPALARSLKPPTSEGAVWDLQVGFDEPLNDPQEVTIVLNEQGARPSGFQRYVVDRDRGRRLAVSNQSVRVELTDDQPTRHLRVIVGTEAFAEKHTEGAALTIEETKLRTNAPNPFTEATTIPYQLAEKEKVRIAVYDVLGRRVQTLVNETREAGVYELEWRPGQAGGRSLASGIYFCRMEAGDYTATRKLVLVR